MQTSIRRGRRCYRGRMVTRLIEWLLGLFKPDPEPSGMDLQPYHVDPSPMMSPGEGLPRYISKEPPWLKIALGELHTQEISGSSHNPRILEYHSVTTLRAQTDEVPWCSAFACWVVEQSGIPSTQSASARSWIGWGDACEPFKGAITILSRGSDPTKGHVGFYMGEEGDHILLLGGNQGDEVNISSFPKERVIGYRTCRWS